MRARKTPEPAAGRGTLPRFVALLGPERSRLILVSLFGVVSVGFIVIGPIILGYATNIVFDGVTSQHFKAGMTKAGIIAGLRAHGDGQLAKMFSAMDIVPGTGIDYPRLGHLLGLAALAYLLSSGFGWAQGYIMAGIAQRTVYRLRQAVEGKLARLPLQYFDSHPHGDTLSRVTNDIDNISTTLNDVLSPLLTAVLTVAASLGLMFWISPLLGVVSLVTIPLTALVAFVIARRAKAQFTAQWAQVGKLNGLVEETHAGHALVLTFGQRQAMIEEFCRQNDELQESSFRAQFLSGVVLPAVQFVGSLN